MQFSTFGFASALGLAVMVAAPGGALAEGDPAAGQRVYNQCRACHVLDQETNRVGPHLVGIWGREAGTVEGFNYSPAMRDSDITWDEENLRGYLANPREFMPGNRMAFAGVRNETQLNDLLAYLKAQSE